MGMNGFGYLVEPQIALYTMRGEENFSFTREDHKESV